MDVEIVETPVAVVSMALTEELWSLWTVAVVIDVVSTNGC